MTEVQNGTAERHSPVPDLDQVQVGLRRIRIRAYLLEPLDDIILLVPVAFLLPSSGGRVLLGEASVRFHADNRLLCEGLVLWRSWCRLGLVTISFTVSVTVPFAIAFTVSLSLCTDVGLACTDARRPQSRSSGHHGVRTSELPGFGRLGRGALRCAAAERGRRQSRGCVDGGGCRRRCIR